MTAGWAGGCLEVVRAAWVAIAPCARLYAGSLHAVLRTSPTVVGTDPGQRAWAGASLGAQLRIRVAGPVEADLGGEAIAPLVRHRFVLENEPGTIFMQGPVTASIFLGLGVAFP